MRKFSRFMALAMATCLTATAFVGCTSDDGSGGGDAAAEEIFFLNFKPEIEDKYEAIVEQYKEETGVTVKVVTAASGQYEQTLTSEIAKSDPPTIFQINGPVGYQNWADYCADLSDTDIYGLLSDAGKDLAVKNDDGVYGVPYAVEGYGIIYNDAIMTKYFESADKATDIASVEEIDSFADLKAVTEDMTKMKDELGIEGVFASTSMAEGNDWRWQTHLANLPLYYEFMDKDSANPILAGLEADSIEFTYGDDYKNIFDLYINNSVTEKNLLSSKTVDDSMAEFALGKAAMVQNGNWGWGQISGVEGNVTKEDDIKFLPIYTGVEGEETQGICIGTENYFAINSQVSEEKQKASADFLNWLFSSEEGKKAVTNELGFITPFTSFSEDEQPTDPLAKEILRYQAEAGTINNPVWLFTAFPSEQFKADFGAALLEYTQDQKSWDEVSQVVVDSWATERAATAQ